MRNHLVAAVIILCPAALAAQQEEPALEVYALTGGYYHGNKSAVRKWEPQVGVGVLAPVGRNWAAIVDFTTSEAENFWDYPGFEGAPRAYVREKAFTFAPSFVRIWRWDRFSFYGGGGVAVEHRRRSGQFRPLEGADENGQFVYGDLIENARPNDTSAALLLRSGTVVKLTEKLVFRADYSLLPRFQNNDPSQSITVGVGYRFGK